MTNDCSHWIGCKTRDGRYTVVSAVYRDGDLHYPVLVHFKELQYRLVYTNDGREFNEGIDSASDIMLPETGLIPDGEYPPLVSEYEPKRVKVYMYYIGNMYLTSTDSRIYCGLGNDDRLPIASSYITVGEFAE